MEVVVGCKPHVPTKGKTVPVKLGMCPIRPGPFEGASCPRVGGEAWELT